MDKTYFQMRWGISDELIILLDEIYLRYTKEQAIGIIRDYYDSADEIYNSFEKEKEKVDNK